jgi:type II secretory pathway component PulJ
MKTKRALSPVAGLTMIELMVALAIGTAVLLALWFNYAHQQEIWKRGRDKVLLQQAVTQASEAIGRDVRFGARAEVSGASTSGELRIFDRQDNLIRRYRRVNGVLMAGNEVVVPESCAALEFTMLDPPDTNEVRWLITLVDNDVSKFSDGVRGGGWANKVTYRSSAFLRNVVVE